MNRTAAEADMVQGYIDGFDLDAPEPSANRSRSYRHGFANGRDDKRKQPRAPAEVIRVAAEDCLVADTEAGWI